MEQSALFHESIEQALDEVIRVCGGRKAFAAAMWPDKATRDAHNLLDACLNPDRRERLAPHQVLYILCQGRAAGSHVGMRYLAEEAGYAVTPIEPEDERVRLQREFVDAVKVLRGIEERLARVGNNSLHAIK